MRPWLVPAGLALLAATAAAAPAGAQDPAGDQAAVLGVVKRLFDGMRAGDSGAVRATFHPQALLATTVTREGSAAVRIDTVDAFHMRAYQLSGGYFLAPQSIANLAQV